MKAVICDRCKNIFPENSENIRQISLDVGSEPLLTLLTRKNYPVAQGQVLDICPDCLCDVIALLGVSDPRATEPTGEVGNDGCNCSSNSNDDECSSNDCGVPKEVLEES